MSDKKTTTLTIREDRPAALASSALGANVDAVGFNLTFLALRNPKLAVEVLRLYAQAHSVQEHDPEAPEEDIALFSDELRKMWSNESGDER